MLYRLHDDRILTPRLRQEVCMTKRFPAAMALAAFVSFGVASTAMAQQGPTSSLTESTSSTSAAPAASSGSAAAAPGTAAPSSMAPAPGAADVTDEKLQKFVKSA